MGGVKIWLRIRNLNTGEDKRMLVEGFPCEIRGVTMMVHKNPLADKGVRRVWRVTDPISGAKATDKDEVTRKRAVENAKFRAAFLEQERGKPYKELVGERRKAMEDVMGLPERGSGGDKKPVPA